MEKKNFTSKATTKEQYLKFKDYIKSSSHGHGAYVNVINILRMR